MITFDFDGESRATCGRMTNRHRDETLTQPIWNEKKREFKGSSNPNKDVIAKMNEFHRQGKDIAIITSRRQDKEVGDFIKQYDLPVPLTSIYCTASKIKARTLNKIGSELHFD